MKKLKATVVGCGSGGNLSISALHESDRYELVALADLNAGTLGKLKESYPQVQTFTGTGGTFPG